MRSKSDGPSSFWAHLAFAVIFHCFVLLVYVVFDLNWFIRKLSAPYLIPPLISCLFQVLDEKIDHGARSRLSLFWIPTVCMSVIMQRYEFGG